MIGYMNRLNAGDVIKVVIRIRWPSSRSSHTALRFPWWSPTLYILTSPMVIVRTPIGVILMSIWVASATVLWPPTWPCLYAFCLSTTTTPCTWPGRRPTSRGCCDTVVRISPIVTISLNTFPLLTNSSLIWFPDFPQVFLGLFHVRAVSLCRRRARKCKLKQPIQNPHHSSCYLNLWVKDRSQLPLHKFFECLVYSRWVRLWQCYNNWNTNCKKL